MNWKKGKTYPRNPRLQEAMEHMLVGQDLVLGQSVQELLQHALALLNHRGILLALVLDIGVVGYYHTRM